MSYIINKNVCTACGICAFECYFDAVTKNTEENKTFYQIEKDKCRVCGQCADACASQAIALQDGAKLRTKVSIVAENCIGCSLCARVCPVGAITGVIKQPYVINQERCIRCGLCETKCKKDAVRVQFE